MSGEDNLAPETQDQPAQSAPEDGTSAAQVNDQVTADTGFQTPFNLADVPEEYREHVGRYVEQVKGAYTRKTQEIAQQRQQHEQELQFLEALRSDPAVQEAVFRELAQLNGYELDEDDLEGFDYEDEDFEDGEDANYDPRVDYLLQQEEQRARERQLDELDFLVDEQFDALAQSENAPLSDDDKLLALSQAVALELYTPEGAPDVTAAWDFLKRRDSELQKRWLESKKAPQLTPEGSSGSPTLELNTEEARAKAMAQIIAAHSEGGASS